MSKTENYEIPYLTPNQTQREDVYNEGMNVIDSNIKTIDDKATASEQKNTDQDTRLDDIELKDTEQDGRLDTIENKDGDQDTTLNDHELRITDLEENGTGGGATDMVGEVKYFRKGEVPEGWYELQEMNIPLESNLHYMNGVESFDLRNYPIYRTSSLKTFSFDTSGNLIQLNPEDGSIETFPELNLVNDDIIDGTSDFAINTLSNTNSYARNLLNKVVGVFQAENSDLLYIVFIGVDNRGETVSHTNGYDLGSNNTSITRFNTSTRTIDGKFETTSPLFRYSTKDGDINNEYLIKTYTSLSDIEDIKMIMNPSGDGVYIFTTLNYQGIENEYDGTDIHIEGIVGKVFYISDIETIPSYSLLNFDPYDFNNIFGDPIDTVESEKYCFFYSSLKLFDLTKTERYKPNNIKSYRNRNIVHYKSIYFDENDDLILYYGTTSMNNIISKIHNLNEEIYIFYNITQGTYKQPVDYGFIENYFTSTEMESTDNGIIGRVIQDMSFNTIEQVYTGGSYRRTKTMTDNMINNNGRNILITYSFSSGYGITNKISSSQVIDNNYQEVYNITSKLGIKDFINESNIQLHNIQISSTTKFSYEVDEFITDNESIDNKSILIDGETFYVNKFSSSSGSINQMLKSRRNLNSPDEEGLILAINGVPQ